MNQGLGHAARATIDARYADEVAGQAFVEVWERLLEKSGKGKNPDWPAPCGQL